MADEQRASIADGYLYRGPLEILSITPQVGLLAGGSAITIAGAGFINFRLESAATGSVLTRIDSEGAACGRSDSGKGKRVMVEFVSANPTGPPTSATPHISPHVIPTEGMRSEA